MDVNINLDGAISVTEKATLKIILNCDSDEALLDSLSSVGKAAMNEYLEMILGKQLPTRGDEIRERRLYHLLKSYYINRLPNEAEISSMFQLTETGSRSLLRNVRTKFRFNLESEINATVCNVLAGATRHDDGSYHIITNSENILEEIKRVVDIKAVQLQPITKVKDSNGVHRIPADTYNILLTHYDVTAADLAATARERD